MIYRIIYDDLVNTILWFYAYGDTLISPASDTHSAYTLLPS